MSHLRTFTKEFKLYGIKVLPGSDRTRILLVARDGETWDLIVPNDDVPDPSEMVIAKYREVKQCVLAMLPEFPSGFEIITRIYETPQHIVDGLFGKEVQKTLEDKLQDAIDREDYKAAADIRDKIKKLEKK